MTRIILLEFAAMMAVGGVGLRRQAKRDDAFRAANNFRQRDLPQGIRKRGRRCALPAQSKRFRLGPANFRIADWP